MDSKSFDKSLYLTTQAFYFSGIEVGFRRIPRIFKWYYYFNIWWLYTDVVGEVCWLFEGIRMGKSIDLLCVVAPCSALCVLSTAKTLPMVLNNGVLKAAIAKLKSIHPMGVMDNFERQELRNTSLILNAIITILMVGGIAVVILFPLMPAFLMGYDFLTTGSFELQLPFFTKYFLDVYSDLKLYSFMYFHQFWSTAIVSLNIFAADTLFFSFCSYLKMHFNILAHNYENIVGKSHDETMRNVRKCVTRHQELIQYENEDTRRFSSICILEMEDFMIFHQTFGLVDQMNVLYSKSNLVNIMSSSLIICLCGFNITVIKNKTMSTFLLFTPFLVNSLTEIYLMCFFGDKLIASSTQITESIYNSRWYETGNDVKKSVLLVLFRSQKPCRMTAASFADLHLRTFTTILSRSWSYFALLRTMYD